MEQTDILTKYFPALTECQFEQFKIMGTLYPEWNSRINVISRKDIDGLYERHILHSLAIAKFLGNVKDGASFMDLGTGGGFPGIPLAVFYPGCTFHLVDRIAKKLLVAEKIAEAAGITNVTFQHGDAGECHTRFDFVVSRAVMPLDGLVKIASHNIRKTTSEHVAAFPQGLVCLKGGDLRSEIEACGKRDIIVVPVADYFAEPFFDTKQIVYVPNC